MGEGRGAFFLRVKGESMVPTLWDGDNLLIRRQAAVENDAIAVALIEGEVVVKRVGTDRPSSHTETRQ